MWICKELSSVLGLLSFCSMGHANPIYGSPKNLAGIAIDISTEGLLSLTPSLDHGNNQPFLLRLDTYGCKPGRRSSRAQLPTYLRPQGITSVCNLATTFTIYGDQLFADSRPVCADEGASFQSFLHGSPLEAMSGGFFFAGDILQWRHQSSMGSTTVFCLSETSNNVLAIFDPSAMPANCAPVNLVYVPYAECFPPSHLVIRIGSSPEYSIGPETSYPGDISFRHSRQWPPGSGYYDTSFIESVSGVVVGFGSENADLEHPPEPGGHHPASNSIHTPGGTGEPRPSVTNSANATMSASSAAETNTVPLAQTTTGTISSLEPSGTSPSADSSIGSSETSGSAASGTPTPAFTMKYSYIGCYVANPDGNFGLGNFAAQRIITTSINSCASLCASQPAFGSLYFTLGTMSNGSSVCTCGNDITAYSYIQVGMNFKCNLPCKFAQPSDYFCGGQYGVDPLVSVFGAI